MGNPDAEGLLVHVINVTMTSPMMGPPDLCYTYRTGDPDHKAAGGGGAYLHPGDSFNATSDPAAILPNLLPAGIEITNYSETKDFGSYPDSFLGKDVSLEGVDITAGVTYSSEAFKSGVRDAFAAVEEVFEK